MSMTKKERFTYFLDHFSKEMPDVTTELKHENPYELIVAVILSAQCTDKRVNMTMPAFIDKFPNPLKLASSSKDEVFDVIKSISYPNNKSKHLIGMAKMLTDEFKGKLPDNIDDLMKLPGVGRKTANVLGAVLYRLPVMAVDTHVFRVAARIGLTHNAKTPLAAEQQLVQNIPEEKIHLAHHWLILHGRYICVARSPKCDTCALTHFCKYYTKNIAKSKNIILN